MAYWDVGNDLNTRMREDAWVAPGGFLKDFATPQLGNTNSLPHVSSLLNATCTWKWALIDRLFPTHISNKIRAIHPSFANDILSDTCVWSGSNSGNFSISSMYGLLNQCPEDVKLLSGEPFETFKFLSGLVTLSRKRGIRVSLPILTFIAFLYGMIHVTYVVWIQIPFFMCCTTVSCPNVSGLSLWIIKMKLISSLLLWWTGSLPTSFLLLLPTLLTRSISGCLVVINFGFGRIRNYTVICPSCLSNLVLRFRSLLLFIEKISFWRIKSSLSPEIPL